MTLSEYYNQLYDRAVSKIASGEEELDDRMNRVPDEMGLILRLRPPTEVRARIEAFLAELRHLEPEQYYYPDSDIHVSVASLILPNKAFQLSQINTDEYIRTVRESVSSIEPFEICFRGITASPGAVMIQGFENEPCLAAIRYHLQNKLNENKLEHAISGSYSVQTAHSTVVRFRKKLQDRQALLALLEKYRNFDFGCFPVSELELVHNDWLHRNEYLKLLASIELSGNS
ncbi:2'-5' RNA ligase family protein [Mangrovibacterium diazotrophicum]|uniref:2'-5' RNA ligase superfamily protein n=1 Tax=Mangrovibacterium diazotrophicum TaxID=1261403 RepID=A0A419W6M8_9BACT|nr:2'-5' RNA ligase family protein [Mangrovibacterium diazotrophicum]RKD91123.1 2'-5' RNA ligase superfamily protein [Mangrovibacterium diazotrophicum]